MVVVEQTRVVVELPVADPVVDIELVEVVLVVDKAVLESA